MKHLAFIALAALLLAVTPGHAASGAEPKITQITNYMLYCKPISGGRQAVWMNSDQGTFALNGHAIEWAQVGLVGNDGKPWKIARDYLAPKDVHQLIQDGLAKCR